MSHSRRLVTAVTATVLFASVTAGCGDSDSPSASSTVVVTTTTTPSSQATHASSSASPSSASAGQVAPVVPVAPAAEATPAAAAPYVKCTDQINYANDPRSNAEINSLGEQQGYCPPPQQGARQSAPAGVTPAQSSAVRSTPAAPTMGETQKRQGRRGFDENGTCPGTLKTLGDGAVYCVGGH